MPLKGNSRLVVPTTRGRPTATQTPARRRPVRNSAAASTSRNRPATGLASEASTLHPAIAAARRAGVPRGVNAAIVAMSANVRPRPKVTRPEAALHDSANAAHSEAGSATGARNLFSRCAVRAAESVPVTTATVRMPNSAIRYGDITL
jgi:hypothetical protein